MGGAFSNRQFLRELRHDMLIGFHGTRGSRDVIEGHFGAVDGREMNLRQRMSVTIAQRRGRRGGMVHTHDFVLEEVTGLSRRHGNSNLVIMEGSGFGKNSIERHLNKKKRKEKG